MSGLIVQNMVAYVCVPAWGGHWAQVAVGLWWIDAIISVAVNLGMLMAMYVFPLLPGRPFIPKHSLHRSARTDNKASPANLTQPPALLPPFYSPSCLPSLRPPLAASLLLPSPLPIHPSPTRSY